MNDQYEVCLNGRWFYITEQLLPEYASIPGIVIYKISRELLVSNAATPTVPPTVSSTSPENP